jgi:hypothetical protein
MKHGDKTFPLLRFIERRWHGRGILDREPRIPSSKAKNTGRIGKSLIHQSFLSTHAGSTGGYAFGGARFFLL